mmetsp:Transcript_15203/g.13327  ORF Transcript_15203/g.13327 Transcript_15203/m.13327 type:complete len:128 (-) Transcript_15203:73-456(-)
MMNFSKIPKSLDNKEEILRDAKQYVRTRDTSHSRSTNIDNRKNIKSYLLNNINDNNQKRTMLIDSRNLRNPLPKIKNSVNSIFSFQQNTFKMYNLRKFKDIRSTTSHSKIKEPNRYHTRSLIPKSYA